MFHILPHIYTANQGTFPIQMYAIQYRMAVISEATSIIYKEEQHFNKIMLDNY